MESARFKAAILVKRGAAEALSPLRCSVGLKTQTASLSTCSNQHADPKSATQGSCAIVNSTKSTGANYNSRRFSSEKAKLEVSKSLDQERKKKESSAKESVQHNQKLSPSLIQLRKLMVVGYPDNADEDIPSRAALDVWTAYQNIVRNKSSDPGFRQFTHSDMLALISFGTYSPPGAEAREKIFGRSSTSTLYRTNLPAIADHIEFLEAENILTNAEVDDVMLYYFIATGDSANAWRLLDQDAKPMSLTSTANVFLVLTEECRSIRSQKGRVDDAELIQSTLTAFNGLRTTANLASASKPSQHGFHWLNRYPSTLSKAVASCIVTLVRSSKLDEAVEVLKLSSEAPLDLQFSSGSSINSATTSDRLIKLCPFRTVIHALGQANADDPPKVAQQGKLLFNLMKRKNVPIDVNTLNAMIALQIKAGDHDSAMALFSDLQITGHSPNGLTYSLIISSCIERGDVDSAMATFRIVHPSVKGSVQTTENNIRLSPGTYRTLISLAASKGNLGDMMAVYNAARSLPELDGSGKAKVPVYDGTHGGEAKLSKSAGDGIVDDVAFAMVIAAHIRSRDFDTAFAVLKDMASDAIVAGNQSQSDQPLKEAESTGERKSERQCIFNVSICNVLVESELQNGRVGRAVEIVDQMRKVPLSVSSQFIASPKAETDGIEYCKPDQSTLSAIIIHCCRVKEYRGRLNRLFADWISLAGDVSVEAGKQARRSRRALSMGDNLSSMISVAATSGSLDFAEEVFDYAISKPLAVSPEAVTALTAAAILNFDYKLCEKVLDSMKRESGKVDRELIVSVLKGMLRANPDLFHLTRLLQLTVDTLKEAELGSEDESLNNWVADLGKTVLPALLQVVQSRAANLGNLTRQSVMSYLQTKSRKPNGGVGLVERIIPAEFREAWTGVDLSVKLIDAIEKRSQQLKLVEVISYIAEKKDDVNDLVRWKEETQIVFMKYAVQTAVNEELHVLGSPKRTLRYDWNGTKLNHIIRSNSDEPEEVAEEYDEDREEKIREEDMHHLEPLKNVMAILDESIVSGIQPDSLMINRILRALLAQRIVDPALQLYERAYGPTSQLKLTPDEDAMSMITYFLSQSGQMETAMELYEELIALGYRPWRLTLLGLVSTLKVSSDYEEAARVFVLSRFDHAEMGTPLMDEMLEIYVKIRDTRRAFDLYKGMKQKRMMILSGRTRNANGEPLYPDNFYPAPMKSRFIALVDGSLINGELQFVIELFEDVRNAKTLSIDQLDNIGIPRSYRSLTIPADLYALAIRQLVRVNNYLEAAQLVLDALYDKGFKPSSAWDEKVDEWQRKKNSRGETNSVVRMKPKVFRRNGTRRDDHVDGDLLAEVLRGLAQQNDLGVAMKVIDETLLQSNVIDLGASNDLFDALQSVKLSFEREARPEGRGILSELNVLLGRIETAIKIREKESDPKESVPTLTEIPKVSEAAFMKSGPVDNLYQIPLKLLEWKKENIMKTLSFKDIDQRELLDKTAGLDNWQGLPDTLDFLRELRVGDQRTRLRRTVKQAERYTFSPKFLSLPAYEMLIRRYSRIGMMLEAAEIARDGVVMVAMDFSSHRSSMDIMTYLLDVIADDNKQRAMLAANSAVRTRSNVQTSDDSVAGELFSDPPIVIKGQYAELTPAERACLPPPTLNAKIARYLLNDLIMGIMMRRSRAGFEVAELVNKLLLKGYLVDLVPLLVAIRRACVSPDMKYSDLGPKMNGTGASDHSSSYHISIYRKLCQEASRRGDKIAASSLFDLACGYPGVPMSGLAALGKMSAQLKPDKSHVMDIPGVGTNLPLGAVWDMPYAPELATEARTELFKTVIVGRLERLAGKSPMEILDDLKSDERLALDFSTYRTIVGHFLPLLSAKTKEKAIALFGTFDTEWSHLKLSNSAALLRRYSRLSSVPTPKQQPPLNRKLVETEVEEIIESITNLPTTMVVNEFNMRLQQFAEKGDLEGAKAFWDENVKVGSSNSIFANIMKPPRPVVRGMAKAAKRKGPIGRKGASRRATPTRVSRKVQLSSPPSRHSKRSDLSGEVSENAQMISQEEEVTVASENAQMISREEEVTVARSDVDGVEIASGADLSAEVENEAAAEQWETLEDNGSTIGEEAEVYPEVSNQEDEISVMSANGDSPSNDQNGSVTPNEVSYQIMVSILASSGREADTIKAFHLIARMASMSYHCRKPDLQAVVEQLLDHNDIDRAEILIRFFVKEWSKGLSYSLVPDDPVPFTLRTLLRLLRARAEQTDHGGIRRSYEYIFLSKFRGTILQPSFQGLIKELLKSNGKAAGQLYRSLGSRRKRVWTLGVHMAMIRYYSETDQFEKMEDAYISAKELDWLKKFPSWLFEELIITHAKRLTPKELQVSRRFFNDIAMHKEELPSAEVFRVLVECHSLSWDVDSAEMFLGFMDQKGLKPTIDLHNAILYGWARLGRGDRAERWVSRMLSGGVIPDKRSYLAIVTSHLRCREMDDARTALNRLQRRGWTIREGLLDDMSKTLYTASGVREGRPAGAEVLEALWDEGVERPEDRAHSSEVRLDRAIDIDLPRNSRKALLDELSGASTPIVPGSFVASQEDALDSDELTPNASGKWILGPGGRIIGKVQGYKSKHITPKLARRMWMFGLKSRDADENDDDDDSLSTDDNKLRPPSEVIAGRKVDSERVQKIKRKGKMI